MANLLDLISNANPQAPAVGAQQQALPKVGGREEVAKAFQASAPGLSLLEAVLGANDSQDAAMARQQLVQQLGQQVQAKDYVGAISTYSQLDPEGVKTLIPQMKQIDPSLAGSLQQFEEKGKLTSQTEFGSNPAQLKAMDLKIAEAKGDPLEDDRQFRREERFQNAIIKTQEKLNESTALLDSAYTQAELATTNPNAALNLGRSIIRAIEGPGARVSNEDFKTAVGSQAVGDKLFNNLKGWEKGTVRPKTQKEIIEMLDAAKKVQQAKFNGILDNQIRQSAKRFKIPVEAAREMAFPGKRAAEEKSVAPKAPTGFTPGSVIKNKKTGQQFMVQPDGSLKPVDNKGSSGTF